MTFHQKKNSKERETKVIGYLHTTCFKVQKKRKRITMNIFFNNNLTDQTIQLVKMVLIHYELEVVVEHFCCSQGLLLLFHVSLNQ